MAALPLKIVQPSGRPLKVIVLRDTTSESSVVYFLTNSAFVKTSLQYVLKSGVAIPSGSSFLLAIPIGPNLLPTQCHVQ
jgi:hypothetical protein